MSKRSRRAVTQPTAPTKKELHLNRRDEARLRNVMIVFGSLLGLVALLIAGGLIQQYWLKPRAPIAVVNGTRITANEYRDRALYEKFRLLQRFGPLAGSGTLAQQINQYLAAQLPNQVFETMITDEVLRQEAARQGIQISDDEVTKAIQAEFDYYPAGTPTPTAGPPTSTPLPTATVGAGTPQPTVGPTSTPVVITEAKFKDDYSQYLDSLKKETGLGEGYVRDAKRAQLLYDRFRAQAIAAASIPATSLQVHARQIQVDTEDDAKKVVERLKKGEDFAAVAKEVSKDDTTKDQGGDLGWFAQGAKDPVIEKAAFSQPVNAIGDPIKSGDKWYIIQVVEAPQQRPLSEEERRQKEQQAFDTFLSDLQSKATIERDFRPEVIPQELLNPTGAAQTQLPVPTARP